MNSDVKRLENCINQGKIEEAIQSIISLQHYTENVIVSLKGSSNINQLSNTLGANKRYEISKLEIIRELVEEYGIEEDTARSAAAKTNSVQSALDIILKS